jgi:hypothetical protein
LRPSGSATLWRFESGAEWREGRFSHWERASLVTSNLGKRERERESQETKKYVSRRAAIAEKKCVCTYRFFRSLFLDEPNPSFCEKDLVEVGEPRGLILPE